MTIQTLENRYLNIRHWIRYVVLPTFIILCLLLLIARRLTDSAVELNNISVILAFVATYWVLFKAGHIYLIRSLHLQLKKDFETSYPEALSELPRKMKLREIGFSLAAIKAELIRNSSNKTRPNR